MRMLVSRSPLRKASRKKSQETSKRPQPTLKKKRLIKSKQFLRIWKKLKEWITPSKDWKTLSTSFQQPEASRRSHLRMTLIYREKLKSKKLRKKNSWWKIRKLTMN